MCGRWSCVCVVGSVLCGRWNCVCVVGRVMCGRCVWQVWSWVHGMQWVSRRMCGQACGRRVVGRAIYVVSRAICVIGMVMCEQVGICDRQVGLCLGQVTLRVEQVVCKIGLCVLDIVLFNRQGCVCQVELYVLAKMEYVRYGWVFGRFVLGRVVCWAQLHMIGNVVCLSRVVGGQVLVCVCSVCLSMWGKTGFPCVVGYMRSEIHVSA